MQRTAQCPGSDMMRTSVPGSEEGALEVIGRSLLLLGQSPRKLPHSVLHLLVKMKSFIWLWETQSIHCGSFSPQVWLTVVKRPDRSSHSHHTHTQVRGLKCLQPEPTELSSVSRSNWSRKDDANGSDSARTQSRQGGQVAGGVLGPGDCDDGGVAGHRPASPAQGWSWSSANTHGAPVPQRQRIS